MATSPNTIFAFKMTITVRDRYEFEDAIERLIDMLDAFDPDPDLEPSLGWNGYMHLEPLLAVDIEGDFCDDEFDCCDNPIDCGWPGALFGPSIGLEPFADPAKIPTRDLISGAVNMEGAI